MSRMTSLILGLRHRADGRRWIGACVAVLALAALVWFAVHARPIFSASRLPARPDSADTTDEQRLAQFAETLDRHEAQINGRSLFFIPPRPRPPRPTYVEDTTPREPPKPTRYGGPAITAMVNGQVWFSDGQRLAVGESGRGVKIVAATPPWSARVLWEGVEFDVDLFLRDSLARPVSHSTSDISPLTPAPATTEPAAPARPRPAPPVADEPPAQPPAEPADEPADPAADPDEPEPQHEPEPAAEPSNQPTPEPQPEPQPSDPESL